MQKHGIWHSDMHINNVMITFPDHENLRVDSLIKKLIKSFDNDEETVF